MRRHGIVYGFNILDPETMQVRIDYVGQTVQKLGARERQHRGDDWSTDPTEQPWSDLIVGKPFVIEQGWWTQAELDERERFHIKRLQPRYNYVHNLDNPERIPIPVARRQREERDRAKGLTSPTWERTPRVQVNSRELSPTQKRAAGYAALWLVVAVVLWSVTGEGWWHGPAAGAVGASAAFVFSALDMHRMVLAAMGGNPRRRRRPARRSSRRRR